MPEPTNAPAPASPRLPEAAIAALNLGQKLEAIKATREALGIGLKEAKELVDAQVAAQPHLQAKFKGVTEVSMRGCILFLLALAGVVIAVVHYWPKH